MMRSFIGKFQKLCRILLSQAYTKALIKGTAAAVEHERILSAIGSVAAVVDIGANRGQFALTARHCYPAARIVSFEPLSGPADIFQKVFASDANVVLHRYAVGEKHKECSMHVSRSDDSSSLLPITDLQDQIFPGTAEEKNEPVTVVPLSEKIGSEDLLAPALLKIDVQGYELPALQGCETLLSRFDHIYVECSFVELYEGQALADDVVKYLQDRGFRLEGVYNLSYQSNGVAIQGDFLFSRLGLTRD